MQILPHRGLPIENPIEFHSKKHRHAVPSNFSASPSHNRLPHNRGKIQRGRKLGKPHPLPRRALRGEADVDDCFQPGYFEVQVPADVEKEFAVTCAVSHESQEANEILGSIGDTIRRLKMIQPRAKSKS